MAEATYKAQIVSTEDGSVEWESQPQATLRQAEKMASGAGINLDWSRFHTRTVEVAA